MEDIKVFTSEEESVFEEAENVPNDPVRGGERGDYQAGESLFDKAAAWVLTVGVFLFPLFFFPNLTLPIEFGKSIFIAVITALTFFLWVIARLKEGTLIIPMQKMLVGGIGIVLAFLAAAILSPAFHVSFTGFIFENGTFISIFFFVLLMLLASLLFQNRMRALYFYGAILASFALVFLFHLLRLLFGTDFLSFGLFTSNIASVVGKWNDVAVFSGVAAILSLLAIEFGPSSKTMKAAGYVVLAASLVFLALVNFFLSWLIVGIVALIMLVYSLSFGDFLGRMSFPGAPAGAGAVGKRFSAASVAVLLIAVLFLVSGDSIGRTIAEYTNISHLEVRPSWQSTSAIVAETWKGGLFFGSGPNRFSNQWLLSKPDAINNTIFWNADFAFGVGLIPTFAVTTGAVGVLAWVVFFIFFLYSGFRALFSPTDASGRFIALSAFAGALYIWIISIFYVPNVVLAAYGFLFTGVFAASQISGNNGRNVTLSFARDPRFGFVSVLGLIVLLVLSALGSFDIFQKYTSLSRLHEGRVAFNEEGNFGKAEETIERAIRVNEYDNLHRLLVDIEVARLNQLLLDRDTPLESIRAQFQDVLGRAISAGQRAAEFDGSNYANWFSLGRVYAAVVPLNIAGAYENAKTSFDRARELNPKSPAIVFEEARLEASRGNNAGAKEVLEEALAMKGDYTDALFLSAQIAINEGNVSGAVDSLERASLINPNDVGLFFRLGLLKYSQGDYRGAIAALERARSVTPNYSNAKYFLGLSYHGVGREEEALREFKDIETLNQDNAEVKQIIGNLEAGNSPLFGIVPPAESPVEREEPPISE